MVITQEFLKRTLDYNLETGEMVWIKPNKYHNELIGRPAGGVQCTGSNKAYWNISLMGKKYKRSRLAWLWMTGRFPKNCIDHKDGNSLNDKWENLREATITQNAWNHKKRKRKCALPMGVRETANGKYLARIGYLKKQFTIGTFETVEEAQSAYLKEREKRFGEFA